MCVAGYNNTYPRSGLESLYIVSYTLYMHSARVCRDITPRTEYTTHTYIIVYDKHKIYYNIIIIIIFVSRARDSPILHRCVLGQVAVGRLGSSV